MPQRGVTGSAASILKNGLVEPLLEMMVAETPCTKEGRVDLSTYLLTFTSKEDKQTRKKMFDDYNVRCNYNGFSSHTRVKQIRKKHLKSWNGAVHLCFLGLQDGDFEIDGFMMPEIELFHTPSFMLDDIEVTVNKQFDNQDGDEAQYRFSVHFDDTTAHEQKAWINIIKIILQDKDLKLITDGGRFDHNLMSQILRFITLPQYTFLDAPSFARDGFRHSFADTLEEAAPYIHPTDVLGSSMATIRQTRMSAGIFFENVLSVEIECRQLRNDVDDRYKDARFAFTTYQNGNVAEDSLLMTFTHLATPTPTYNLLLKRRLREGRFGIELTEYTRGKHVSFDKFNLSFQLPMHYPADKNSFSFDIDGVSVLKGHLL